MMAKTLENMLEILKDGYLYSWYFVVIESTSGIVLKLNLNPFSTTCDVCIKCIKPGAPQEYVRYLTPGFNWHKRVIEEFDLDPNDLWHFHPETLENLDFMLSRVQKLKSRVKNKMTGDTNEDT